MKILSIDVGLINLAIVGADLPENYLKRVNVIESEDIFFCDRIDITELVKDCDDTNCELFHDLICCDYMMHLFKKFRILFDSVETILIERQPPTGLVAVQELIMREYRSKSILVSPSAMLNFLGLLQYEYKERKIHTEKIAMKYLGSFKEFIFNERRHDMADAFCILYYYLSIKRQEYEKISDEQDFKSLNKEFITNLEQFRYIPDVSQLKNKQLYLNPTKIT